MQRARSSPANTGANRAAMTDILCRQDAYLRNHQSQVVAQGEGGFATADSPFYPQGGGQLGDSGTATWEGCQAEITATIKGPDGQAQFHLVAEGQPLPPMGTMVTLSLDWSRRHRLMRVHTALHLLCRVVGAGVTGGQIGEDKGRLDFDLEASPDKAELETAINALIAADHPVSAEVIDEAILDEQPELVRTMSVQPPRGTGSLRMVRIGTPEASIDYQPCGGTHVASTAEIGPVTIGKIEKKGKANRRIYLHLAD